MLYDHIYKKMFFLVFSFFIFTQAQTSLAAERPDSSIIVEAYSGKVLYANAADSYRYPASLTKMMTLYLLFDELKAGRLKMSSRLKASKRASNAEPSRLGLRPGQTISVKDAMYALITKSANDVAITIAENIAGSESKFAKRMTKKARQLGMRKTTFKNASGLPNPGQKTTARDMATLGRMLLIRHAHYYHYFNTKSYNIKGRVYRNHNGLLGKYDGIDGIKTGYIKASGFNLVASAKRNDMRLVGVVMGGETSASRNMMMRKLLDKGFFSLTSKRKNWISPKLRPNAVARAKPTQTASATVSSNTAKSNNKSPNGKALEDLLIADNSALKITLPPRRIIQKNQPIVVASKTVTAQKTPPTPAKKSLVKTTANQAKKTPPQPRSDIDASEATFFTGQYAIAFNTQTSQKLAEEKGSNIYDAIKVIVPTGKVQIYSLKNNAGQQTYKPMIQGLGSADALTACQLVKAMGENCKIITSKKDLALNG